MHVSELPCNMNMCVYACAATLRFEKGFCRTPVLLVFYVGISEAPVSRAPGSKRFCAGHVFRWFPMT